MACREGRLTGPTSGFARGYLQANLVALPQEWAADFQLFCERNPLPCPLLEVTAVGDPTLRICAHGADLRSDLPKYLVWGEGALRAEADDVRDIWRDDFVSFLFGCSFSFESELLERGLPVRHIELGRVPPVYRTNIRCTSAGRFSGPLVVSMRPFRSADVALVAEITSRYPIAHGGPIHIGDPKALGIERLDEPDFGDPPQLREGEVPVFWACGVTPLAALIEARPPIALTHKSGHMFVTDLKLKEFGSISAI